ncbi:MAG: nucleotidyltransferase family protein [Gammaproteobacteria bacterium]|nr:nucleotidyltransferase family protein [Gammaproteobacteria bacterium]NVK87926.1 nucleotidyltransferase family protein [Gammaproteobacteria bacterium]
MIDLSVVILAGGPSTRLGVSKQMIRYRDETLIAQSCRRALQLSQTVTVISGANRHSVEAEAHKFKVDVVYNPDWEQGLASSLALAVKHEFNCNRLLLMNCDQPLVPMLHYQSLVQKSNDQQDKIIATETNDRYWLPAVFPHRLFYELTTLKEDETPIQLIESHLTELSSLPCPQAAFSIDSPDDMRRLRES